MKLLQKSLTKLFVLVFATSLVFSSCEELTENTKQTINFNADDMHFSIDSLIFTQNKATNENVVVFNDTIDLGEALDDTDYSVDDIENISVTEATIVVDAPQ